MHVAIKRSLSKSTTIYLVSFFIFLPPFLSHSSTSNSCHPYLLSDLIKAVDGLRPSADGLSVVVAVAAVDILFVACTDKVSVRCMHRLCHFFSLSE